MATVNQTALPDGIKLDFFQRHRDTILAVSALTAVVSLFAVGYFAALGAASFMIPVIPLSLMAVGATSIFITALIKKPPPEIQRVDVPCNLEHNPPCNLEHNPVCTRAHVDDRAATPESDDVFEDALGDLEASAVDEDVDPNSRLELQEEADADFEMVHSDAALSRAHLQAVHDHTDINSLEQPTPLGLNYITFDQVNSTDQAIEELCTKVINPLFNHGKEIYRGIISLYIHTYGYKWNGWGSEGWRCERLVAQMELWNQSLNKELTKPDFLVWMGIDSAFALDLAEGPLSYRNGEKTLGEIRDLLKCKAFAICGDARLGEVINHWFERSQLAVPAQTKLSEERIRAPLVRAYNEMEETQKAKLTWLFASMIQRRFNNDLLIRWENIIEDLQLTDSEEALQLNKIHWSLNETAIWIGGRVFASKIHDKIAAPLIETPLERFIPLLIEMSKPLMLPLALAKCPISRFHPVLRAVVEDSRVNKSNLVAFAESLKFLFEEKLA